MNIRNKFLELRFCICEDESQIDNFVDVAEDFAICFAEWLRENYYDNGELWTEWNSDDNTHSSKELLEMYKKENRL